MFAHRDTLELQLRAIRQHSNQREVRRPAADVTHQDDLAVPQMVGDRTPMRGYPGIERGQRLFEEPERGEPGGVRRLHRQLACFFVERRRHREHDRLAFETPCRIAARALEVPGVAQVTKDARRGVDWRQPYFGVHAPRQNSRGAIDRWIGQPGFRGHDLPRRRQRAVIARELADDEPVAISGRVPRQRKTAGCSFGLRRHIDEGRQHRAPFDLVQAGKLRDVEGARRLEALGPRQRRIGRSEIDADDGGDVSLDPGHECSARASSDRCHRATRTTVPACRSPSRGSRA